jgi:branched-chain amino acid transport system ATP-binding protein
MAPLLELDKVSLAFGGLRALHELDLHVDEHEIVSVIGPNGAGKSTVFNVDHRHLPPDYAATSASTARASIGRSPHAGSPGWGSPAPSRACACF